MAVTFQNQSIFFANQNFQSNFIQTDRFKISLFYVLCSVVSEGPMVNPGPEVTTTAIEMKYIHKLKYVI